MNIHRIIYYYQTFIGLSSILKSDTPVTHIHLSAIHFGVNTDGSPYIHLNNYPPNNKIFDSVKFTLLTLFYTYMYYFINKTIIYGKKFLMLHILYYIPIFVIYSIINIYYMVKLFLSLFFSG